MLWLTNSTVLPVPARHLSAFCQAFLLELGVADGEHLVHDRISGSRWAATAKASRTYMPLRIALDGRVEELLHPGEGDDFVELALDLGACHAEDGAVEEDVLAAGQLGVEASADLEQAGHPAAEGRHGPRWAR